VVFKTGSKEKVNMKKTIKLKLLVVMLSTISIIFLGVSCQKETPADRAEKIYQLRESGPAGGVVFYDKGSYSNGWRYLEAWIADEAGTYQWKTTNDSTAGTSTAIGSGYANTYNFMTGANYPAAQVVKSAAHGGKNDWFLPSKDELYQMCWVLHSRKWNGNASENNPEFGNNRVGSFADDYYWSSSEINAFTASYQNFYYGTQPADGNKTLNKRVRAIRAF